MGQEQSAERAPTIDNAWPVEMQHERDGASGCAGQIPNDRFTEAGGG
jgi:hypothetical protein